MNIKPSTQLYYKCLGSFYLEVGWASALAIGNDADVNSLPIFHGWLNVILRLTIHRPLSLPFVGGLYLAVVADISVTDNKMTVNILTAGNAAQRAQLSNTLIGAVCCLAVGTNAAIVDFDLLPTSRVLGGSADNGFFDRGETVIP